MTFVPGAYSISIASNPFLRSSPRDLRKSIREPVPPSELTGRPRDSIATLSAAKNLRTLQSPTNCRRPRHATGSEGPPPVTRLISIPRPTHRRAGHPVRSSTPAASVGYYSALLIIGAIALVLYFFVPVPHQPNLMSTIYARAVEQCEKAPFSEPTFLHQVVRK